jgi:hypothetical protein
MRSKVKSWLDSWWKTFFRSSPHLRLLSHYEESTVTIIVVRNNMGQVFKEKLARIARNQAFIQQFSAKDAHLLGYLLGHEDTLAAIACEKSLAN